jgi:SNF2 family DNA or RNA helicase
LYVHTPTRSLILKVRDPLAIRLALPAASKTLALPDGHNIAVKWTVETARVLRNMGISAPSPITAFYDWPGLHKPAAHQVEMAAFCTLHDKLFNLSEPRTGKTYATLWAADYLMKEGLVHRALIATTVSTMRPTWAQDCFKILPHRQCVTLHGANQKARLKHLNKMVDFYIINHDGIDLETVALALRRRPDIDLVIVDEAAFFTNPETDRYRFLHWIMEKKVKLWQLTGSPTPQCPSQAWALANLVKPMPISFSKFRDSVTTIVSASKRKPSAGSTEKVFEILQPAIRFKKRDVWKNLPPLVGPRDVHAPLSKEQVAALKTMRVDMRAVINDVKIGAVNGADKILKLRQILCGSVKDPNTGAYQHMDCDGRIDTLRGLIEEASAKVLVIAPFKGIVRHLADQLPKPYKRDGTRHDGFKTLILNGDVTMAKRPAVIKQFKEDCDVKAMVCHPKVMAHGLDFAEADTTVFFGPIYSNDEYTQVIERFSGMAQKNTMYLYRMLAHPMEATIYKTVDARGSMQSAILELYEEFVNGEDEL